MTKQMLGVGALAAGALLVSVASSARGAAGDGDVQNGKVVFDQCASCHTVDGGESDGPTLLGVFGRKAGGLDGYRYSAAMTRSTIVWDDTTLDAFITDPQASIPGNKMAFAGIDDKAARADLIAYLSSATKK
jgi:cytochrome c